MVVEIRVVVVVVVVGGGGGGNIMIIVVVENPQAESTAHTHHSIITRVLVTKYSRVKFLCTLTSE